MKGRSRPYSSHRVTIDPAASDHRGTRVLRHPSFIVMNHGNQHVHGGFANQVVALVHARPLAVDGTPFVLDETDILRHPVSQIEQPAFHLVVEGKNDIRFVLLQPSGKHRKVGPRRRHIVKRSGPLFERSQAALTGEKTCAETPFDQRVDHAVQHQSGPPVSQRQRLFESFQSQRVLVTASK